MLIGELIKRERQAAGLTQEQLATRLGVKKAVVSHWESGIRTPARENLQKLGEMLGINPGTLLEMGTRGDDRFAAYYRTTQRVKKSSHAADKLAELAEMLTDPRIREILELLGTFEDHQRDNLLYVVRGVAKFARQSNPSGEPVRSGEPLGA